MAVNALRIPRLDCADQGLPQPGSVPPQSGFLPSSVPPTNAREMVSSLAPDTVRAIHDRSSRHAGSFIKRNCAAISTGLLESELFGRETAAFIGARAREIEWREREEDRFQSATCRSICNLSILNQPVVISSSTPARVVFRVNPAALSVSWHSAPTLGLARSLHSARAKGGQRGTAQHRDFSWQAPHRRSFPRRIPEECFNGSAGFLRDRTRSHIVRSRSVHGNAKAVVE